MVVSSAAASAVELVVYRVIECGWTSANFFLITTATVFV